MLASDRDPCKFYGSMMLCIPLSIRAACLRSEDSMSRSRTSTKQTDGIQSSCQATVVQTPVLTEHGSLDASWLKVCIWIWHRQTHLVLCQARYVQPMGATLDVQSLPGRFLLTCMGSQQVLDVLHVDLPQPAAPLSSG